MTTKFGGAQTSNLGDHYHFLYAVRRMIDMLHPRTNLQLLVMEGVGQEDIREFNITDPTLAADITEYYGGRSFSTADKVVITQLKYSLLHQTHNWTLSDLCRLKNPRDSRSSVLGKMAKLFSQYATMPEFESNKLVLQIYTNQPLESQLAGQLNQIVQLWLGKQGRAISMTLSRQQGELKTLLQRLKQATHLTWEQLGWFLTCWARDAFAQPTLPKVEQHALAEMQKYIDSETQKYVDRLTVYAMKCAEAGNTNQIMVSDVFYELGFTKEDFFPAPYKADHILSYQLTRTQSDLQSKLQDLKKGFLVVHGSGGQGKSTELQYFAENFNRNGYGIVVYDCWAGGVAQQPGAERYQLENFLTQVINELDTVYHTHLLANRRDIRQGDPYEGLLKRFGEALSHAAAAGSSRGEQLVIIVDAADEAVKTYQKRSLQRQTSSCFVATLWDIVIPENCIIIVSSRTENLDKLGIPESAQFLLVRGFDLDQTASYIHSRNSEITVEIIEQIHSLSDGVPRIVDYCLQRLDIDKPADIGGFITQVVRSPLEESYRQACADADNGRGMIPNVLAALYNLRQPTITVLAQIFNLSRDEINLLLQRLYFGISIYEDGRIQFRNKNFEDYVEQVASALQNTALSRIADYCLASAELGSYAFENLVFHAYQAKKYRELIDKQVAGHLAARIRYLQPHPEDALEDIQYGLLASLEIEQIDVGISFVVIAAEISHGGDVFAHALESYPDLAVTFNYYHRLVKHLQKTSYDINLVHIFISIARYLEEQDKDREWSKSLREDAFDIVEENEARIPQSFPWELNDVMNLAIYTGSTKGLVAALEELYRKWKQHNSMLYLYSDLVRGYQNKGEDEAFILRSIDTAQIDSNQKLFAKLGLLQRGASSYYLLDIDTLAQNFADVLPNKITDYRDSNTSFLSDTLILFLDAGVTPSLLPQIIERWEIRSPSVHDVTRYISSDLSAFMRCYVLREMLDIGTYSLEQYTPAKEDREGGLPELRLLLKLLYPASKALVQAVTKVEPTSVIKLIAVGVDAWSTPSHYIYNKAHHYRDFMYEALKAIVALPTNEGSTVEKLLLAMEELGAEVYNGWIKTAEILAQRTWYHPIVERLLDRQAGIIVEERMSSRDRVDSLLTMSRLFLRMDMLSRAQDIFSQARIYAEQWDYNAFGRSKALVNVAQALQSRGNRITPQQAFNLLNVFDYVNEVSEDERGSQFPHVLRVVSQAYPDAALTALHLADVKGKFDIGLGILSVGDGILDGQVDTPQTLWPLIHMSHNSVYSPFVIRIAEKQPEMVLTSDAIRMFDAWGKKIRLFRNKERSVSEAKLFIDWGTAHKVEQKTLQRMQSYQHYIEGIIRSDEESGRRTKVAKQEQGILADNTILGGNHFERISKTLQDETPGLSSTDMKNVILNSLSYLTKSQVAEIATLISKREWRYDSGQILELLVRLAEHVGTSPSARSIQAEVQLAFRTYLEAYLPSLMYYYQYQPENFSRASHSPAIQTSTFYAALLTGVTTHLERLSADAMYLIISFAAERFSVEQASPVFEQLLDYALRSIDKPQISFSTPKNANPIAVMVKFLCTCLGDPRQEICWDAAHMLIDMILETPNVVLPILLEEAESETGSRWISVREWLMFILHHIALRSPSLLVKYVDAIAFHALNREFPHARIREHSCQTLLLIEAAHRGTLLPDILSTLKQVNNPIAEIRENDDTESLEGRERLTEVVSRKKSTRAFKKKSNDERYSVFSHIDTMQYWFEPLAECFGLSKYTVQEAAAVWVVDKWGISKDQCREDYKKLRKRFGDRRMPYRQQGESPSIVDLEAYATYHALQLVAGEFIMTKAVHVDEDKWHTWDHWMRNNIHIADPAIPARLLDAPPLRPENYDVVSAPFEEWSQKSVEREFYDQLFAEDSEWLVAATYQQAQTDERQFTIRVRSILVHSETSYALGRAIETAPPHTIVVPEFELPDDLQGIEELEGYLGRNTLSKDLFAVETEDEMDERFQQIPFVMRLNESKYLSAYDRRWDESSRLFLLPSPDFVAKMTLKRIPLTFDYIDAEGQLVVKWEGWHQSAGYEDREYVKGNRLLIRRSLLQNYLSLMDRHLLLTVTLQRGRAYHRRSTSDTYDSGIQKTYILTPTGELVLC